MTRVHISGLRIGAVRQDRPQNPLAQRKPLGLWWSEDDAWTRYCEEQRAAGPRAVQQAGLAPHHPGRFRYRLELSDTTRLLTLATTEDLHDFTARFGVRPGPEIWLQPRPDRERWTPPETGDNSQQRHWNVSYVAWEEVARDWDGIEITAGLLQDQERPYTPWLDTDWTVPGGCLWRMAGSTLTSI